MHVYVRVRACVWCEFIPLLFGCVSLTLPPSHPPSLPPSLPLGILYTNRPGPTPAGPDFPRAGHCHIYLYHMI